MWRRVISKKLGEEIRGWCTCDLRGGFGTWLQKEIRKEWETPSPLTMYSIENSIRVSFWKDIWCGEEALDTSFPAQFALAAQKEASVADVWDNIGEVGGWSPCS